MSLSLDDDDDAGRCVTSLSAACHNIVYLSISDTPSRTLSRSLSGVCSTAIHHFIVIGNLEQRACLEQ